MSERTDRTVVGGWVFYDDRCSRCTRWANFMRASLNRRRYVLAPLHGPRARILTGRSSDDLSAEMIVLTPEGRIVGGADAVVHLARTIWWLRPLAALAGCPPLIGMLRAAYRWLARHRHCTGGICRLARPRSLLGGLVPVALFTTAAVIGGMAVSSWGHMLLICGALYGGMKWWTLKRTASARLSPRMAGYLIAWPGMDADTFLDPMRVASQPRLAEWVGAFARTAVGAMLVGVASVRMINEYHLAAAWAATFGFLLTLHMGAFDLLWLLWRRGGVDAERLCDRPFASKTLDEFWGR